MKYDIESILEMYEDDYNPTPRPMNQEPRNMYNQGQLVSNTVDGSRPGYKGRGRDLKDKPSLNVGGKNQYTPRTTKEIQAIIDANPEYITPKNFYEPTNTMKQKGMKKLLTFTDTENSDVVFQRKGQPDPDPAKQTARNTKRTAAKKNLEGRIVQLKSPKGYQVHHIMPLAGNEKLNTGDYAVVSKEMNAKMSKYNRKINKLVNEAYNLDYSKTPNLKRLDKINNDLFDILKTVKKDLPKEYKGLLGFNKLTPVLDTFDDKGKQVFSAEPQGIDYKKSIAGVRGDKIKDMKKSNIQDLVNKAPKFEIKKKQILSQLEKLGCGKAAGGRINMRTGGPTDCALAGQKKLAKGLAVGFKEGEGALAQKILQAGKGLKNMASLRGLLGPAALGFTVAAEAGIVGYDMLATGKSFKDVVGNSLFNNLLGDKTKIDTDEIRYKNYERLGINTDQIKKFEEGLGEINQMAQVYNDAENSNYKMLMGQTTSNPRVSQAMRDRSNKALILKNEKNQQAATDLTTELSNPEKQKSLNEFAENTDLNRSLIASADQRVAANEIQKPSTANFRSGMQTIFPRSNYDSETDKIINYQPVMQDYYRTNQYSAGGIADLMKKKND